MGSIPPCGLRQEGSVHATHKDIGKRVEVHLWHESHVLDAESARIPLQPFVEYGWILKDYSVTALYDFFSSYYISNYELNLQFVGLFLNRSFYSRSYGMVDFWLMGLVGVLYEFHRFVDSGNANVPGYELEVQDVWICRPSVRPVWD